MAKIQTFSREEFEQRQQQGKGGRGRSAERQALIDEYKEHLQPLEPGDGGEVQLEEGELKRTVRLLLTDAAKDLDKPLKFYPVRDNNLIRFQVITLEEKAAQPRRGGRPKKAAS